MTSLTAALLATNQRAACSAEVPLLKLIGWLLGGVASYTHTPFLHILMQTNVLNSLLPTQSPPGLLGCRPPIFDNQHPSVWFHSSCTHPLPEV